jgi:hypothetical protein
MTNIERHTRNKYELNKINKGKETNRKKINKEKFLIKKSNIKKNTSIDLEDEPPVPSYYNNSLYQLEIKKSTIECAGLGVFASEFIPAKVCIGKYEGVKKRHNKTGEYYFEINYKVGIDAISYPRCYMAMINDAFNTENTINCEFVIDEIKEIVEIWSIKNISTESELFISYGRDYWINY